jgi:Bacterial protein of unknown function (DUF885)
MKKTLVPLALGAFILFGFGFLFSQQNAEEGKFQKTVDTYLDAYWKFYPTAATLAGYHKYDDRLEDLSGGAIEKHHETLDTFNQELVTRVDRTKLGQAAQVDYDIVRNALELELIRHEALLPWEYNPVFYNDIFYNSIRGLLTTESAPIEARLKSAAARATALVNLVKQARENLKTPPQAYTETAIAQFPGILAFYTAEAAQLAGTGSGESLAKFQAELAKATAALQGYETFLKSELLARSTGNFRLGEQTHVRMLSLTSEFSIPPTELVARARADYNNIRREMAIVSMPFYRIMYPNINMEQISTQYSEEQLRNIFIKGVLDKVKTEHATEPDFVAQVKTDVDAIKAFLTQKQLAPLPDAALTVEPMPLAESGITLTKTVGPGAYESGGTYTAYVASVPEAWTDEQATSFLEGYNNYYLNFLVSRYIYPGPYAPLFFTQKNPSVVRKLYPNLPLIKGWPSYVTDLLVANGFGNYDLRLRLNQLKFQLKTVIDFLLELNIHEGSQSKEDAIKYMVNGGFQTEAEAEQNWNRILLKPGDAAYAYIGLQEIIDMQKDYKKLKGDAFTEKEFLEKLLSFGAMPIRYLKTSMAQ